MEQKKSRVSDAIPEMPASFDRTVEDTLRSVCTEQNRRASRAFERRPVRLNKKAWIAIAVAATLLITTTAVAAAAIFNRAYTPETYMMVPPEQREQIPDIENAIASAKPETGACTITVLPEMENADELNSWRESKGQPVYSEADWGWLREIRPEVQEVLIDGNTLIFNIRLNTDHGLSFAWDSSQPQMVDALCDDAYYITEDGRVGELPGLGTGVNPQNVTADGATLYTECDLDDLQEAFPTDGTVQITAEIGIRDVRVDDMSSIGILAKIRYTFTFDASAGADVAEPIVTERALSGSTVLTVWDENGIHNERVSLDGVVLEETVSFRSTGVYVTYKVKSAPEGWTEQYAGALLFPSHEDSASFGITVVCAAKGSTDESEIIHPGTPNSIPHGEYTVILPFFPSDYGKLKERGYELCLGYRSIGSFNGEPVGEDWSYTFPSGTGEYDVRAGDLQPLGVFELRLP